MPQASTFASGRLILLCLRMNKGQGKLINAKKLWREIHKFVLPFPDGAVKVRKAIPGTAFFPGGYGLWLRKDSPTYDIPTGQIMIVGQDFNSVRIHEEALLNGTEVCTSATWRELLKILKATGISVNQCFFTNLYMGLRKGPPETGRFPGAKDKDFEERCLTFFNTQLEMARPKLIIVLGLEPFRVLAKKPFNLPVDSALRAPSNERVTWKNINLTECNKIYRGVKLVHGSTTIVLLTHPSYYKRNVKNRNYKGLSGEAAETRMIADGLKEAFAD